MKTIIYLGLILLTLNTNAVNAQSSKKGGWISLFDSKTLNGWKNAQRDTLPEKSWSVENGEIKFDPSKGHGSDIITTRSFKDFEFTLQFKISEGGNSGIKYFLIPNTSLGCEFQIIDDMKHPDAKLGVKGDRKTGALYDLIPPAADKPYKPAGEWNTVKIIVKGNHAEHWLNGKKILEYDRSSEAFKEAIANSKFKNTKGFAEATSSPILLQAHGDKVAYRDIKIKEL